MHARLPPGHHQRFPPWRPSLFSFANAPMRCLEGHTGCVNTLRWSSDGTLLFSGSDDRRLGVWTLNAIFSDASHDGTSSPGRLGAATQAVGGVFLPTAHRHNIFDIAIVPFTNDAVSITAAADGTIAINDLTAESSVIHYSAQADGSGGHGNRMAQQVHCIAATPHVLVAAVAMQIQLFDLRVSAGGGADDGAAHRAQCVLGGGSAFCALPHTCGGASGNFLIANRNVVREVDLRCPIEGDHQKCSVLRPPTASAKNDNLLVSGMDVSPDGAWVAISRMGGAVEVVEVAACVPSLRHRAPTCCIGAYQCLATHDNSRTFLKKPSMFHYNRGWCVAHGGDCGSAFLYELRDGVVGNPILSAGYTGPEVDAVTLLSTPTPLTSVPRSAEIARCVSRLVDSGVCNVVAPHPSLVHHNRGSSASLNAFATSGLDASIKVVAVTDDDEPMLGAHGGALAANNAPMAGQGPRQQAAEGPSSSVDKQSLLAASQVVKAIATRALQQNRLVHALEVYRELAAILLNHPLMVDDWQNPQPPESIGAATTAVVALLSNAQLTALKVGKLLMCKNLCDVALGLDPHHAKSFYRRALVSRSLGAVENALIDVQQASQYTGGADAAVEALREALATEAANARIKEKQRFAKMFGR